MTFWQGEDVGYWVGSASIALALALTLFALLALYYRRMLRLARYDLANSRELIENLSDGVYRSTPDGRQISANKALVHLNGYESEPELLAAVGDIASEWYVDPNRRDEFRTLIHRDGSVTDFVSEIYRHKTRERIWITESARLVRSRDSARPLYYEGSVREITETMERLRLEKQFRKLMSAVPGTVFQFTVFDDHSATVDYVSPGFERLSGMTVQQLRDEPKLFEWKILEEDRKAYRDAVARGLTRLEPCEAEFRFRIQEGGIKWFRFTATPERIAGGVTFYGQMSDISRRKLNEMAIERLAYYDSLTNLPNRRQFMDRMARAIAECARTGTAGALLFIDLDNFKTLNDTHGHDTGDRYLTQVASRLRGCVEDDVLVARIGGDEFVVAIEGLGEKGAATRQGIMTANRVLTALRDEFCIDGVHHRSSASVGVVTFDGTDRRVEEALKKADIAMYRAKAAGRNGMALYRDPPADAPAQKPKAEIAAEPVGTHALIA